jgi:hypothetical protein
MTLDTYGLRSFYGFAKIFNKAVAPGIQGF